jgi:TonB family protein
MFPAPSNTEISTEIVPPQLEVEWSSRWGTFFRNLWDTLIPRSPEPLNITSEPSAEFWRDVFVIHPSRLRFIFDSYASHILFVLIVYGLSTSPLFNRRPQSLKDPFANTHIEYYPVSPYLPPVATPPKPAKHALQGQPALAKQEIISVPPEPDNSRQTIVTPDLRVLRKEVPLPNVVVWGERPAPIQPASEFTATSQPKLLLPPDVIPPPAEEIPRNSRALQPTVDVIRPAETLPTNAKARVPSALTPAVIEPPQNAENLQRKVGTINLAKLGPEVAPPKLPVPEQRSPGAPGGSALTSPPAPAVAPPPSLQGVGSGKPQGRMLALSVQPAEVKGPIEVPQGSRKGVFAAGPEGKEGAPGTPSVPGGGNNEKGAPGKAGAASHDALEGIYVGPAPAPKASIAGTPDPSVRGKLLSAMKSASTDLSRVPPAAAASTPNGDTHIENRVFGNKRYYSMVLNMPNLTSSVGSWIIRYAELIPSVDKADLSAPVALNKVDPAYPAEFIRDRVEGTVVLYAVIHANGTVDGIRVLESGDKRLNDIAMNALSRWRFRPGTKQGVAVDIEAVVQVPFRITKWRQ